MHCCNLVHAHARAHTPLMQLRLGGRRMSTRGLMMAKVPSTVLRLEDTRKFAKCSCVAAVLLMLLR